MPSPGTAARQNLLCRLLDKYERGAAFGRPGPWRQDVIVRLDARQFPEAFAPEGREALADLRAAAEDLAREGAVRLVRHRGYAAGLPHEVRIGPDELARAYELAAAFGFRPLGDDLRDLATLVTALCAEPGPEWMAAYLGDLAARLASADLSPLGVQRERFKRERRDVRDALTAAAALARGLAGWERVVSERIFGDSKRLAAVRPQVVDILLRADPRWEGLSRDDAPDLLEVYGVRRKPALLRCAGRATLTVGARVYELEDFAPAAHLPGAWAGAWIDAVAVGPTRRMTSIENETAFLAYVEEAGGPAGLGDRGELAVYTAGFPDPTLLDALATIATRKPSVEFRHWGDADLGGLRIWWLIRTRLGCPVALYRTRAEWLEATVARGNAQALEDGERAGLARLRRQLEASPWAGAADLGDAVELIAMLVRLGRKAEQERW
jgi:Uncharacterized protein conserved in bacteria C-term(DUF2220)